MIRDGKIVPQEIKTNAEGSSYITPPTIQDPIKPNIPQNKAL